MKAFTLSLAISTLILSLGASAAPPSGYGGGRPPSSTPPSNPSGNRTIPTRPAPAAEAPARGEQPDHPSRRSTDDILTNNTKLAAQIQDLTGANAQQACSGFKNLGECVSAAHASKNLQIDFQTLKTKITGPDADSLGEAIGDLKPEASARSEARKARRQSEDSLKTSGE